MSKRYAASNVREQRQRLTAALGASALLVLLVFSSLATAGQEPEASSDVVGLPIPATMEGLGALTEDSQVVSAEPVTVPAAAEELPHTDLGRSEAENLMTSVFPSAFEEQTGPLGDLEVEAFHSDFVAVVAPAEAGGEPGLLSSVLPLRVENEEGEEEAVSLDLEDEGEGGFAPANPLVDVQIPASLSGSLQLPETEISIDFPGLNDHSASSISDSAAFYPNVASETDLSIVPIPTGVETLTQLRSPDAPLTQDFNLNLPAGATLHATEGGGAAVSAGNGDPLLAIHRPTAIDAEGESVSVEMEVSGSTISVIADPEEDAAFPILVDPVFESYSWKNTSSTAGIYSDWRSYSSNSNVFKPGWIGTINGQFYSGLALRSSAGATSPGTSMSWNYYVPRYFSDFENEAIQERPGSYIRSLTFSQVYYVLEDSPVHGHPYMLWGLWDESTGKFASYSEHGGWEGSYAGVTLPAQVNPNENKAVKNGGMAMVTYENTSYPRQTFIGSATVEVSDRDYPEFFLIEGVPKWVSSQAGEAINFTATDEGLGVYQLRLRYPAAQGGRGETVSSLGCPGTAAAPCPRNATKTKAQIAYDPSLIAQGVSFLEAYAVDPIGHWSEVGLVEVKVDREQPELGLSGTATEQKALGTGLSQYGLKLDVKDGDEASASAALPVGAIGTGTGQLERPFGVAADSAGNIWIADATNNRLVELDKNGSFVRQITTTPEGPFKEIRGITIAPDGNLWVAEKGNKRVMKFSPTGQFISKFTNSALEPFDLAVSNTGIVWVTDLAAQKVFQFKEDGTLVRTIGSNGNGALNSSDLPFGIALDEFGNAWIAMQATNRILEISPSGSALFAFGSSGSSTGQFNAPFDVSVASSGNLFVSDGLNHRIQEFKPDGGFMRQFGTLGAASNQLENPKNIAVGPGNKLLIADYGNKRIARWEHADRHVESGAAKTEVKVDGAAVDTYNPGCAAGKNCSLSREWILKADNYPVGTHKVDVIATDGVGLKTEKTMTVETHGDLQAPTIALSGTMTEQATLGTTRPTYKLKAIATDPGSAEERKSGVASTTIKLDGTTVDSSSPGCVSGGCSITREWSLNSSSYSAGAHTVEVKATDAAGRTTTKYVSVKIDRDTTPPELKLSGALPGAPEGWVQQGSRSATADATDAGGYGVKQIRFMIDGVVVGESLTQACEAGGCPKSKTFWIDMTTYDGGAHGAVMIAEDLAGNVRKEPWTINVDPEGHISASEAEETLEALEDTAEVTLLEPTEAEEDIEGSTDDLTIDPAILELEEEGYFKGGGYEYAVSGSGAPVAIDSNPEKGFAVEVPSEFALLPACEHSEPDAGTPSAQKEEELAESPTPDCPSGSEVSQSEAEPVMVAPSTLATGAGNLVIADSEAAAINANIQNQADLVTRPLYDGGMTFAAIRDPAAPTTYSYRVKLGVNQELKQLDSRHAAVYYEGGPAAFTITARAAHDAIGTAVPTSISVSGTILTLTVNHLAAGPNGQPFIYPVVGGAGWEGGFQQVKVEAPPGEGEEAPEAEDEEASYGGGDFPPNIKIFTYGPPLAQASDAPADGLSPTDKPRREKSFKFTYCVPHNLPADPVFDGHFADSWWAPPKASGSSVPETEGGKNLPKIISECHREDFEGVYWGVTVFGKFHYIKEHWVWVFDKQVECKKWGEEKEQPAKMHCKALLHESAHGTLPVKAVHGPLDVIGEYRFAWMHGQWVAELKAACFTLGGKLYPNPRRKDGPAERPMIWHNEYITPKVQNCNWW